jgi:hypothetical protein
MQETIIGNMPVGILWIIAIAQIFFAIGTLLCAFAFIKVMGSLVALINEANSTLKDAHERLPRLMDNFGRR